MELRTIAFKPAHFAFYGQFLLRYLASRKQHFSFPHQYSGILRIRDPNFSAIEQFSALARPQTKYEKPTENAQYFLSLDTEDFPLDVEGVEKCFEGQVIAVDGDCRNQRLYGTLVQFNSILARKDIVPEAQAASADGAVLLFSDVQGNAARLCYYAEFAKRNKLQTIVGGNIFADPLYSDTNKIMRDFEFSPMDEYFSASQEYGRIDVLLKAFENTTVMTGFTDPTSICYPLPPISQLCLPESSAAIKRVGNPAVADFSGKRYVFVNYDMAVDLEQIVKAGHLFPQAGLTFALQQMEEDCFCASYDVLVAFGQEKNEVYELNVQSVLGARSTVTVISVRRDRGMLLFLNEAISWAEVCM